MYLRCLALALLAAAAALPADKPARDPRDPHDPRPIANIQDDLDDSSWFAFPLFGNMFAPLFRLFPSFLDLGTKVSVVDGVFQMVVNAKGYEKPDLKVTCKGGFIFVQGVHESTKDDLFASQFFHSYSLPANASAADVTAELSTNSFLIVRCPVNGSGRKEGEDRDVPIAESGKEYRPEEAGGSAAADDERREPTTAPPAPDATDADNLIPHGGEPAV